ncbi:MAG TPA: hypothetical protein DET40_21335 [Lentisphaeria bacterium]|nr:MAG: hypothetical protein A2X45_03245 [Lentisphaerae bacterium GWF2_50_93]HCE46096.1 hypothetical protein [Lentisphaeria bacterium]
MRKISSRSNVFFLAGILSLLLLSSCSARKDLPDIEKARELRQTVGSCRAEMTAESGRISLKDAADRKNRSLKAALELRRLAGKSNQAELKECLKGLDEDLDAINDVEHLAVCRQKLGDKLNGFTLSTYRSGREMVISTAFKTLKVAALAAAMMPVDRKTPDKETFSKSVNDIADVGRILAEFLTKNTYADDRQGREELAADLDSIAANPPPEFSLLLSLIYLVSCQKDLALYEIENCNAESFQETNYLGIKDKQMAYHIIRGWILHSFGWEPLASGEFAVLEKMMANENEMTPSTDIPRRNQTLSFWHLFLAFHYGYEEKDLMKMDQHLSWLIRLNPDSELVVYLTGQKLGADGTCVEVDSSIEKAYACTVDEPIIKLFAERIRSIRDSARTAPPPSMMTEPKFLIQLSFTLAKTIVSNSHLSGKIHKMLVSARDCWKSKKPVEKQADEPARTEDVQELK